MKEEDEDNLSRRSVLENDVTIVIVNLYRLFWTLYWDIHNSKQSLS